MTDNELSALVAEKVMGWELSDRGFYVKGINKPESYDTPNNWNPANDIAPAWQVALKVAAMPGYTVTIHVGDEVWIERAVETDSGNDHIVTWQEVARVGTAEGDARAICLAALEAMGVQS